MRTLLTILSLMLFNMNAFAISIVCEPSPESTEVFPEKPFTIELGIDKDTLSIADDKPVKLAPMKKDRLRWEVPVWVDITIEIDARKQVIEVFDEDGDLEASHPLLCKNAEEAEQEYISRILTPGKLEAQGLPGYMAEDEGRFFDGKRMPKESSAMDFQASEVAESTTTSK